MKQGFVRFKNKYGDSKEYAYNTSLEGLERGDLVVVEAADWYQVATFERYGKSDMARKFIVTKIDIEELEENKLRTLEKEDLKKQIELRIKEIEEMNRLEQYAKQDEELSKLLKQYKGE